MQTGRVVANKIHLKIKMQRCYKRVFMCSLHVSQEIDVPIAR